MLVIGLSTIQGIMARPNVLRFVRSGGRAQAKRLLIRRAAGFAVANAREEM